MVKWRRRIEFACLDDEAKGRVKLEVGWHFGFGGWGFCGAGDHLVGSSLRVWEWGGCVDSVRYLSGQGRGSEFQGRGKI